jgi:hypothetical protein
MDYFYQARKVRAWRAASQAACPVKAQINDISVASNKETIKPIICRVPSGLSFKLSS